MNQTFKDANGNDVVVDDEISLLGPNPDLIGTTAIDSPRDLRFQPIRFHAPESSKARKKQTGYSNPIDDPEWQAKHWPDKGRV